jgi:hypothetical protein
MKFVDPVLPSDSEESIALESSLKAASGWKPKSERSFSWNSRLDEQNETEKMRADVAYQERFQ